MVNIPAIHGGTWVHGLGGGHIEGWVNRGRGSFKEGGYFRTIARTERVGHRQTGLYRGRWVYYKEVGDIQRTLNAQGGEMRNSYIRRGRVSYTGGQNNGMHGS